MKRVQKQVKKLMELPWRNEYKLSVISEDEGGGISLGIPLLGSKRCIGDGDTFEEAEENLLVVLEDLLEDYLKEGKEPPKPRAGNDYSGTFIVRATPDLHERLTRAARGQGVSLNYFVGMLLERAMSGFTVESLMRNQEKQDREWPISSTVHR